MANNTTNNMSDHFRQEILFAQRHTYFHIILSFEIILALVGNSLFLLSFLKAKDCVSNMYLIMRGLSIVDIGAALSLILILIRDLLVKEYSVQYELCRYQLYFHNSFFLNNILHLLLMGIDRYIAITWPYR